MSGGTDGSRGKKPEEELDSFEILNGKQIAFILSFSKSTESALQYCLTLTHSQSDGGVNDSGQQPARREQ